MSATIALGTSLATKSMPGERSAIRQWHGYDDFVPSWISTEDSPGLAAPQRPNRQHLTSANPRDICAVSK
jgi:hypothetical protein